MPIPTPNQVMKARDAQRKASSKESARRRQIPREVREERRKYRRRAEGDLRANRYKKLAKGMDKVPVLGATLFKPFSSLLKGGVKTYEAYKDDDNDTVVAVAKEAGKEIRKMKDESEK